MCSIEEIKQRNLNNRVLKVAHKHLQRKIKRHIKIETRKTRIV